MNSWDELCDEWFVADLIDAISKEDDGGVRVPHVDEVSRFEVAAVVDDPALRGGVDDGANSWSCEYCVWADGCAGGGFKGEWFVGDDLECDSHREACVADDFVFVLGVGLGRGDKRCGECVCAFGIDGVIEMT